MDSTLECKTAPTNNKCQKIGNLLLFVTLLVFSLLVIVFYATPITEVGGISYAKSTQNIFVFIADNIKAIIVSFKNLAKVVADSSGNEEELAAKLMGAMSLFYRVILLVIPAMIVLINLFVNFIKSIVAFCKKKDIRLRDTVVASLASILVPYISFVYFGSVSGGSGEDAYYVGYRGGIGMTIGVFLFIAAAIIVSILNYVFYSKTYNQEEKIKWRGNAIVTLALLAVVIILPTMRIYSVFMYVVNSSLTSALGSILQGFNFKSLLFPLLNLALFIACILMCFIATGLLKGSLRYLLNFGTRSGTNIKENKMLEKIQKRNIPNLLVISIISLISIVVVILLKIPAIGYGWSVSIYVNLALVFLFSTVGKCLADFFGPNKGNKVLKNESKINSDEGTKPQIIEQTAK